VAELPIVGIQIIGRIWRIPRRCILQSFSTNFILGWLLCDTVRALKSAKLCLPQSRL